ncbi:phosphatidylinositol-3,5-bisphosphate 5-phosphatase [Talaromyces marneffei ATCC 18224]
MESLEDTLRAANNSAHTIAGDAPVAQQPLARSEELSAAVSDPVLDNSYQLPETTSDPSNIHPASSNTPPDLEDDAVSEPSFPQLSYNPALSAEERLSDEVGGVDEEPTAPSFNRSGSPVNSTQKSKGSFYEKVGEEGIVRMHKFTLYETATRYYLVGIDQLDTRYRVLKIDRTSDSDDLNLVEDDIVYSKHEMNQLLETIEDGNKSSGGLKLRCSAWALLGFIRNPEEARYIGILNNLDLSRSFYFSNSYGITRTLQRNISRERQSLQEDPDKPPVYDHNSMFVWNHHLLSPAVANLKSAYDWCLPIIHGYVDQSVLSVYGRSVYITIIARRSRFFAGARFLKRGANDLGYVANDVETEQIVSEMTTTSFHSPGPKLYANPRYTSYVQHRGSIPLYWTQDSTGVSPKPDIELNLVDPFYSAAALHFDNLFERYGAPVYVLNLIKARERTPRESKLLKEFTNAINYLNQFLPDDKKIIYKAWDMSRASKSRDQNVIDTLESIASDALPITGFFKNGDDKESGLQLQDGVVRTNCIDCLDRTNAAQFVLGKKALGYQLHALGVIEGTQIEYDTDAVNMFTNMWHDHGDTIAIQYGGSHLVNTMATYRKTNQWTSQSRDMVESFKRYYNNSFLDAQRQEAYNLFLGNYIFSQGQPMLWDLTTDYYLHHVDPRTWSKLRRPNYITWYTPEYLERGNEDSKCPPPIAPKDNPLSNYDDYWVEYYRPTSVTSFGKIYPLRLNSTMKYLPFRSTQGGRYDLSPFVVRLSPHEPASRERAATQQRPTTSHQKKGVTIQEPEVLSDQSSGTFHGANVMGHIHTWQHQPPSAVKIPPSTGIMKGVTTKTSPDQSSGFPSLESSTKASNNGADGSPSKAQITQWTLGQLVSDSLSPSVTSAEAEEYERYINHPLKVPLVVTSDDDIETVLTLREQGANLEFLEYVNKANGINSGGMRDTFVAEEDLNDYTEFLSVNEEGLTVVAEDYDKKRYKRYRQWLKGKSLFKQRVDP